MSRIPPVARPSMIPTPNEIPKQIKSTMPNVNVAPVISEQQQVINSVVDPVIKPTESTIKPIDSTPTSTALIVPQQGNIFEMILAFISKLFH